MVNSDLTKPASFDQFTSRSQGCFFGGQPGPSVAIDIANLEAVVELAV
jgi:hypothetical protein